jgi:hypothetical protein
VILSSSAYKYQRRNQQPGGDDFWAERKIRTGGFFEKERNEQGGEKGKPRGEKFWRKREKGRRTGRAEKERERSRNRGGFSGPKLEKNHPSRVPSSCSSLSTVAFGHNPAAPPTTAAPPSLETEEGAAEPRATGEQKQRARKTQKKPSATLSSPQFAPPAATVNNHTITVRN